jgi:hypothetical protein
MIRTGVQFVFTTSSNTVGASGDIPEHWPTRTCGACHHVRVIVRPTGAAPDVGIFAALWEASQGTAHGRFQRAIQRGHVQPAEMAARKMGELSLADAPLLGELLAKVDPARYDRAALRWLQRFHRRAIATTHRSLARCLSACRASARQA